MRAEHPPIGKQDEGEVALALGAVESQHRPR